MNPKALLEHGADIGYEENWVGEVGKDRHPEPDFTRVRGVQIPLTPEEWCAIAMREGDAYIGGCCGQSGYIQDIINGIFRDSGWADADSLYTLGEAAKHHPDGFKEWGFIGAMSQKKFDEKCEKWSKLGPWEKIALCWQAVRDKLTPSSHIVEPIVQANRPDLDEDREIRELYGCIHYLRYAWLKDGKEDKTGQKHADDVHTLAKMLPGARRLVKKLEANFTMWSGVAIVEKDRPTVIVTNGLGACLYNTEKDAKDVIKLWKRDKDEGGTEAKVTIRPVTVSVREGVVFT